MRKRRNLQSDPTPHSPSPEAGVRRLVSKGALGQLGKEGGGGIQAKLLLGRTEAEWSTRWKEDILIIILLWEGGTSKRLQLTRML
mmetsp:Transcript_40233/g.79301  ORF Transcript_40233/g.79301 Transcript_40233/m.79301 type:complete len:85 (+) Transcript_40233:525-779(+)